MTVEQKLEALYNAVNKAWKNAFDGWEWFETKNKYILGENTLSNGFAFFLAGCRDTYGGWIWIEYTPKKDLVEIYIKDRPIKPHLQEDLKNLFEKYSPFNMTVTYNGQSAPIISRKETVLPENFLTFFKEFRNAYDEHYPLFYMFSVSAKKWYDGFCIDSSDC